MKARIMNGQIARDLWPDRRGSIAPIGAMSLLFVIGFAALALDMGQIYIVKNRLQGTADSSALAGASQLPDQTAMVLKAQEYAEKNMPAADYGTVLASADVVAGNWDPGTRTFAAGLAPLDAVRATTRQESASGNAAPVFLGQVFGLTGYDLIATSIATVAVGADIVPSGCITATSLTDPEAFHIFGTADITLNGCDLLVASTDACALEAQGTPTITTISGADGGGIYYNDDGGYCSSGPVDLNPPPQPTSSPIQDPYRNNPDPYPTVPPCDYINATFDGDAIIPPGVYCGGIKWTGSGIATFQNGEYIIKDGPLDIGGNITVRGRGANADGTNNDLGVGFYLTGTNSVVNFKGTSDIALKAPTTGPLKGFIFYEDPDNPPTLQHTLRGTSGGGYDGVLYFQGDVELKGTADSGLGALTSDCTVLIADTVYFNGTTGLDADDSCSDFGGAPVGVGDLVLRIVD